MMRRAILLAPVGILPALIQFGSATLGDDEPTAAAATQIETPAGRVTVAPAPGQSVEAALKAALKAPSRPRCHFLTFAERRAGDADDAFAAVETARHDDAGAGVPFDGDGSKADDIFAIDDGDA